MISLLKLQNFDRIDISELAEPLSLETSKVRNYLKELGVITKRINEGSKSEVKHFVYFEKQKNTAD